MADRPLPTPFTELIQNAARSLGLVSHELHTPLTAVIGYADMLLAGLLGPLSPEQQEAIATILERGETLLSRIDALLDIAALSLGPPPLLRAPVDLAEVVAEVVEALTPEAKRAGVALSGMVEPGLPPVPADRARLRESLRQLADNAVKFNRPGGDAVVMAVRNGGVPPTVAIAVQDQGPGIDPALHGRIFEPFFVGDPTATRARPGAGLGLALVRAHALAHGGHVTVESRPGAGSRFTLILPLEVP